MYEYYSISNDLFLPWLEFAAGTHLLKLQPLQDKVLRTTGNFPSCAVCDLHTSTFCMYTIMQQNCTGNKRKPYEIMRMNVFAA
jgi:hypothetical protein